MSESGHSWRNAYTPLLGRRLVEVVLMPISADTRGVVEALDRAVIGFSGATRLAFDDDHSLHLTWKQAGDDFELIPFSAIEAEFRRFSLNSVMAGYDGDWGHVRGATLARVELLGLKDLPGTVVGAAHVFASDGREDRLMVTTAFGEEIAAGDDLLVCLNASANGGDQLVTREVIQ